MTVMTVAGSGRADPPPSWSGLASTSARRAAPRTRDTPRKRALLEVLADAEGFLSAAQLHDRIRAQLAPRGLRVGITTVYNQLRRLSDTGAVDTVHGDDGEIRYWLPRQAAHHHYLVCRSCGRAVEIVAEPVEEWADTVGAEAGFGEVTHNFELSGLCGRCRDPRRTADNADNRDRKTLPRIQPSIGGPRPSPITARRGQRALSRDPAGARSTVRR
jgi:Fur family transcriptional regulator, ferric uptake regulator